MRNLEVLFSPAEFNGLAQRDLSHKVCVVFDILRATTSMITALDNGAVEIIPVSEISQALACRQKYPNALLAGERDGLRIRAAQTGSIDFDLGNSPREFTREIVSGRSIIMTTTNGTRALNACAGARRILIGSFRNLDALNAALQADAPASLLLVCAGTYEEAAYEDTLAAGAVCDALWPVYSPHHAADSASMARNIFLQHKSDLPGAMAHSRNGRRLLSMPDLSADVAFCLEWGGANFCADLKNGSVQREKG